MKFKEGVVLSGLGILSAFCPMAARAELVTNGGFETGDFSGWTTPVSGDLSGDPYYMNVNKLFANSGQHSAHIGSGFGTVGSISQTLATTPGATYTLTFAYGEYNANPTQTNGIGGSICLNQGGCYLDPQNVQDAQNNPNSPWKQVNSINVLWGNSSAYSDSSFFTSDPANVANQVTQQGDGFYRTETLTLTATSDTTTIEFDAADNQQDLVIDSVSVEQVTPEPGTWALGLTGLGVVLGFARKRRLPA